MSKYKKIEIHAGHWKALNSGAAGILNEVTENRRVGQKVYEILKAANVPATYYEDDTSTNQRDNINRLVAHHNANRDGLIVSFHFISTLVVQQRTKRSAQRFYIQRKRHLLKRYLRRLARRQEAAY